MSPPEFLIVAGQSRVVRARARIQVLKEGHEDAPGTLRSVEEKIARLINQESVLEREMEEISRKLADLPIAEIREREGARRDLDKRLGALKESRGGVLRDIEITNLEISSLNRQVSDLAIHNLAVQKLVKRRDVANRGAEFLEAFLKSNEQKARVDIELAVNRVLDKTTRRHYRFEVDERFQIRLLFEDGTPTPKSGGENQMMSLAFLAALVEYAFKRSEQEDDGLFIPATVAPLILDSPFGQLDDAYRTATAEFLPTMAPQVVLLVSSSQGKKEVIDALDGKIGREYVLIAQNKGSKGDKKQDFLTVGGTRIATTLFGRERNMTEIQEVPQ